VGPDTPDEVLRAALIATYEGCLAKSEIASPWRWAEAEDSLLVGVADLLTEAGIEVNGVVVANRLMPDEIEGADKVRRVDEAFGDALRVKMPWGTGVLANKPEDLVLHSQIFVPLIRSVRWSSGSRRPG